MRGKQYLAPTGADWWLKKRNYKLYILRELTAVFIAGYVLFLLALLFTCPQILLRPVGFEWVLQDLEAVLVARRLDPKADQGFEKAMNRARTRSRVGPPKDKALEYFRYATINEFMNPSAVIPGVTAKMGKTKAVELVAAAES